MGERVSQNFLQSFNLFQEEFLVCINRDGVRDYFHPISECKGGFYTVRDANAYARDEIKGGNVAWTTLVPVYRWGPNFYKRMKANSVLPKTKFEL
jgi:hypothetical protein